MNTNNASFLLKYQSTSACVDVRELIKTIHNIYSAFKGINSNITAKAMVKYASAETCSNWECVVDYLNSIFIKERDVRSLITKVDWKRVCESNNDISHYTRLCRTENAFKEMAQLVALSKGKSVTDFLGEAFLDVYGWDKIVEDAVGSYESEMRKCEPEDIMEYQENPINNTTKSDSGCFVSRKHFSKCKAVIQIMNDGTKRKFSSITDASEDTGISRTSICKNLKQYDGYYQVKDKRTGQRCKFEYA